MVISGDLAAQKTCRTARFVVACTRIGSCDRLPFSLIELICRKDGNVQASLPNAPSTLLMQLDSGRSCEALCILGGNLSVSIAENEDDNLDQSWNLFWPPTAHMQILYES